MDVGICPKCGEVSMVLLGTMPIGVSGFRSKIKKYKCVREGCGYEHTETEFINTDEDNDE